MLSALLWGLCAGQPSTSVDSADPVIAVKGGELRGSLAGSGGAVFKGIPFARPPVGALRWREPAPAKPWTGIRDATAFGSPCVQGGAQGIGGSGDCLYLNVWTPEWPAKSRRPVMIWFHGGGELLQEYGPTLRRLETPTAGTCQCGPSSIRRSARISTSPMQAPWQRKDCGGRSAIFIPKS